MRYIVTGPTGTLGTALCRLLSRKGHEVYAVIRPDTRRAGHLAELPGVKTVPCELSGLNALGGRGLAPCDGFFHLAWAGTIGPDRQNAALQEKNIAAALGAVEAAAATGCRSFVFAGSQAEYGRADSALRGDTPCRPETGYGVAKLAAGFLTRLACEEKGIRHVHCRILSLYGPGDGEKTMISTAVRSFLAGQPGAFTAGEQLWDYLYSEDAAEALFLMAEKGRHGAVYPLGSGRARPLKDYILAVRDAVDPSLPAGLGAVPYGAGQVMHLEADLSELTKDTGFVPKTDFETGIRKTIAYWQEK